MLYLDYAANTPVDEAVLKCFCNETMNYIANPNSSHKLGREAKERMGEITKKLAGYLQVEVNEIIYTSGATEANNLAIKGLAYSFKGKGKHIISTCMEHSSVSGSLTALQNQGYEVDLVDITSDGTVDLTHLRELLSEDTILVSIGYVDSEMGIRQPIEEIVKILKDYKNCYFHTDATQAVGRIQVDFTPGIHCLTFAPHKFFGLNGCGVLLKKEDVVLTPLIDGGISTSIYRSGTPALALAATIEKAVELAFAHREARYSYVLELNTKLKKKLVEYSKVRINSTINSIPYILNLSVKNIKATEFQKVLEQEGVCVSTKSACSVQNTPSRSVYAVTKDRKNAMCSFRVSLSHIVTNEEIDQFLYAFDKCYQKLVDGE
ncbi:MAG: cysteine desulfurase [Clostridiales bacterium]|nr:cysteine desulfurase [Clostridiales bacterium]